ncbi:hypothetical protein AbraIFM66950_003915 [Aspergillus brasiliensis]|nr:hypothetical protein AbraIFM66950_003915 [Aspergillus brasiliensis]
MADGGTIGDTTSPGDLQELAQTMRDSGFDRYDDMVMFGEEVKHTIVLLKSTDILIDARDNHPNDLPSGVLAQAKKALLQAFNRAQIRVKQVDLEAELITFQDIDWQATASATATATGKNTVQGRQDVLNGFEDFARGLAEDETVSEVLRQHLYILQQIRTQSASLGSLAACRALG